MASSEGPDARRSLENRLIDALPLSLAVVLLLVLPIVLVVGLWASLMFFFIWAPLHQDSLEGEQTTVVSVGPCSAERPGDITYRPPACELVVRSRAGSDQRRALQGKREDMPPVGATVYVNSSGVFTSREDLDSSAFGTRAFFWGLSAGCIAILMVWAAWVYRWMRRSADSRRHRRPRH